MKNLALICGLVFLFVLPAQAQKNVSTQNHLYKKNDKLVLTFEEFRGLSKANQAEWVKELRNFNRNLDLINAGERITKKKSKYWSFLPIFNMEELAPKFCSALQTFNRLSVAEAQAVPNSDCRLFPKPDTPSVICVSCPGSNGLSANACTTNNKTPEVVAQNLINRFTAKDYAENGMVNISAAGLAIRVKVVQATGQPAPFRAQVLPKPVRVEERLATGLASPPLQFTPPVATASTAKPAATVEDLFAPVVAQAPADANLQTALTRAAEKKALQDALNKEAARRADQKALQDSLNTLAQKRAAQLPQNIPTPTTRPSRFSQVPELPNPSETAAPSAAVTVGPPTVTAPVAPVVAPTKARTVYNPALTGGEVNGQCELARDSKNKSIICLRCLGRERDARSCTTSGDGKEPSLIAKELLANMKSANSRSVDMVNITEADLTTKVQTSLGSENSTSFSAPLVRKLAESTPIAAQENVAPIPHTRPRSLDETGANFTNEYVDQREQENAEQLACIYGGFAVQTEGACHSVDEVELTGNDGKRKIYSCKRPVTKSATLPVVAGDNPTGGSVVMCNPILFGLKESKPICIPRTSSATEECLKQSASPEDSLKEALANPVEYRSLTRRVERLCTANEATLRAHYERRGKTPKQIENALKDLGTTCEHIRGRMADLFRSYDSSNKETTQQGTN